MAKKPKIDVKLNRAALNQVASQAVDGFIQKMQPVLDEVLRTCTGKPVAEIKPILSARWVSNGGERLPDKELTEWATKISDGQRIVLHSAG